MKISILISDFNHPITSFLNSWCEKFINSGNSVDFFNKKEDLIGGDILFLISCSQIINIEDRIKFSKTLVLHASDLPIGRGWSPYIWAILDGANKITVSLLEAEDKVDTGEIWQKKSFSLDGTELYDEINKKLFNTEMALMTFAIENFKTVNPLPQQKGKETYYRKRSEIDSKLDINKTISEQFDLMRTVDPIRYPAFFEHRGQKYICKLEKFKDE